VGTDGPSRRAAGVRTGATDICAGSVIVTRLVTGPTGSRATTDGAHEHVQRGSARFAVAADEGPPDLCMGHNPFGWPPTGQQDSPITADPPRPPRSGDSAPSVPSAMTKTVTTTSHVRPVMEPFYTGRHCPLSVTPLCYTDLSLEG
jgi:hypothetical protein